MVLSPFLVMEWSSANKTRILCFFSFIFISGFDKKKISQKSLGLYIMCKRAKDINATLDVDSKIGRGTKITVKL